MASPAWYARRERWAEETLAAGHELRCQGCTRAWSLDTGDLHHCDYSRLGQEAHRDLWPLCRACHTRLHTLMDSSKTWRKLPYRQRNNLALDSIRNRQKHATPPPAPPL